MAAKLDMNGVLIGHPQPKIGPIALADFTRLISKSIASDPLTRYLEPIVESYVATGFPQQQTQLIVRLVCAWGGLRGNNPQFIYDQNKSDNFRHLTDKLRIAHDLAVSGKPSCAVTNLSGIKGIRLSFQSKLLRFLCPDHAVVLDSIIREGLEIKENRQGYAAFVADCVTIRNALNDKNIPNDLNKAWRLSEVEMALFAYLKKNKTEKLKVKP